MSAENKANSIRSAITLTYKIQNDFLMLRRFEKDFLFQLDKGYLNKFQNARLDFEKDLHQLINMRIYGLSIQEVQHISELFDEYLLSFNKIVSLQLELGLNHHDGYYAKLRYEAHELEKLLSRYTDENLINHLLLIRRFEKDFMLRSTIEDLNEWREQVKELKDLIDKAVLNKDISNQLIKLIIVYEKDLNSYANNRLTKGLSNKDGLTKNLIGQAHEVENEISKVKNTLHLNLMIFERNIHYLTYACIAAFLLCALIILFMLMYFVLFSKARFYAVEQQ